MFEICERRNLKLNDRPLGLHGTGSLRSTDVLTAGLQMPERLYSRKCLLWLSMCSACNRPIPWFKRVKPHRPRVRQDILLVYLNELCSNNGPGWDNRSLLIPSEPWFCRSCSAPHSCDDGHQLNIKYLRLKLGPRTTPRELFLPKRTCIWKMIPAHMLVHGIPALQCQLET